MSTIRIYKIAEVLGLPSQDVIKILREQHGIELKSASSTLEEVVARQFAERLAKERNLDLPKGQLFSRKPLSKRTKASKKSGVAAEPKKPGPPKLGPPRLVKSAKVAKSDTPVAPEVHEEDKGKQISSEPTIAEKQETTATSVEPDTSKKPALRRPSRPRLIIEGELPTEEELGHTEKVEEQAIQSGTVGKESAIKKSPSTEPPSVIVREPHEQQEQSPSVSATPAEPVTTLTTASPPPATSKPESPGLRTIASEDVSKIDKQAKSAIGGKSSPTGSGVTAEQKKTTATRPTGRVVPPTLRLRVEEPKRVIAKTATRQPAAGTTRPLPTQPPRPPSSLRPLPPRPAVGYRPPPRPHRPGGRKSAQYKRARTQNNTTPAPPPPITRTITGAEGMTVKDLAERLEVKPKDVLKKLIERRVMITINTTLDTDTATMIAREFGADVNMRTFEEEIAVVEIEGSRSEDLVTRAPIVTVMGHVDHGKTTLLDGIRATNVAGGEAGGITQHIGAYSVSVNDRKVVFLDTPGHEAFTSMRARGARVTDIVVLVVAADDGVMPQTQEAIDHAKAAKVPIIVAINKIDKADANPDRVKQELAERDLTPEDWGGTTVTVAVSAKTGTNIDSLLEMILLVSDLGEHRADPQRAATGTVLEAKIDRGRGPVATILVQDGTLHVGDNFIAGIEVGRVRALLDDKLQQTREVGPSSPVEVIGLSGVPQPGDAFQAVSDAAKARQIAVIRQTQAKEKALGGRGRRLTLESLQEQIAEGGTKELPIVIKADVQGSAEVLEDSLGKLGDERVTTRVIRTGVGAISESDILLASTSNAVIIGFNVRPDRNATSVAKREGIDIRLHSVIYEVADELKKAMAGLLDPTTKETQLGQAEIRQTFKVPKFGTAGGCMVVEGVITRAGDAQARLIRDSVVVHEGRIGSLRRFKDDVNEVKTGLECGIAFERFADVKIGDVIESFTVEKIAATV